MAASANPLLPAITNLVFTLPPRVLQSICRALENLSDDATREQRLSLVSLAGQPASQTATRQLVHAWLGAGTNTTPRNLAAVLCAAAATDQEWRRRQAAELVWTGPAPRESSLRRTDQVLLDLISTARERLVVATFAAFKVPSVACALADACRRGVRVMLIIESAEVSAGKVEIEPLDCLGREVADLADIYIWPLEQRPRDSAERYGSLHLKCAIADSCLMFVSSANLTGFALNLNMEMGVLIRGGTLPEQADTHFRNLIGDGILRRMRRS